VTPGPQPDEFDKAPAGSCPHCDAVKHPAAAYSSWKCGTIHDGIRLVRSESCRLLELRQERLDKAMDELAKMFPTATITLSSGQTTVVKVGDYLRKVKTFVTSGNMPFDSEVVK
jgi:uncharacterized protein YlzI (FlbEa/FlbD family)